MVGHALTAAVTCAALAEYSFITLNVGAARGKYGVKAPATTGHVEFDKRYRVQMNTLEHLVVFLPSLWICSAFHSEKVAAGLGALWVLGRALYAKGYYKDPAKRGPGFGISFLAQTGLLLAAMYAVGKQMLVTYYYHHQE